MDQDLSFFQRLLLAFVAFFAVLFNREFAVGVHALRERQRTALPPGAGATETPTEGITPAREAQIAFKPEPPSPAAPRSAAPPPKPSPAAPVCGGSPPIRRA